MEYLHLLLSQVLGSRPLNGNAKSLGMKLWDGQMEIQAVLCLEGKEDLVVPSPFSIIKLEGLHVKGAGLNRKAEISGYKMLRSGTKVGRKLEGGATATQDFGVGDWWDTPSATLSLLFGSSMSAPGNEVIVNREEGQATQKQFLKSF